jgi:hypothetical protein
MAASPDNPFSPNFGAAPVYLAGRADVLEATRRVSLNLARVDYSRATIIVGQRGTGKTVLLNRIEELAEADDWAIVRITAGRGFVARLVSTQLPRLLHDLGRTGGLTATVTLGGGPLPGSISVSSEHGDRPALGVAEYIAAICTALGPHRGLLFAVDEVNSASRAELESFAADYQLAVGRDGRNVALVMCGVQSGLRRMLSGPSAMSFIARAQRIDIGILSYPTARDAFRGTIAARGTRTVDAGALDVMAAVSKGYPYLIQEVGYLAWDVDGDADRITADHVRAVATAARRAMDRAVLSVIMRDIKGRYRTALTQIALRPGIRTSELAVALGIPTTSVADIHQRLLDAGVIARDPRERGVVRITVPYLAEYLTADETEQAVDDQIRLLDAYPDL